MRREEAAAAAEGEEGEGEAAAAAAAAEVEEGDTAEAEQVGSSEWRNQGITHTFVLQGFITEAEVETTEEEVEEAEAMHCLQCSCQ